MNYPQATNKVKVISVDMGFGELLDKFEKSRYQSFPRFLLHTLGEAGVRQRITALRQLGAPQPEQLSMLDIYEMALEADE